MRLLPLCLLALMLTGCVHEYHPISSAPAHSQPSREPARKPAPRPAPVKVYTDAADLVSKPFRDLGEVAGDDCQSSRQDSPPNLATARKRLQIKASYLKANAVLLHKCEIVSSTPGCYRQAICQGSALKVNQ
ncbi:Outer membrane lipoprotein RcsF [Pantoea sp. Nvir]|uniref:Rcs stress response system protein RcsF n=1 Tax=Pantoea TaxID=53335 RepID=UPI000CDD7F76|nr:MULTISPECIES: Rcs stress response system protein RcsF [Pantoea]MCG7367804.1 Rcs stress response system protein RcsF [Pantoea sp. ACRSH]MCG7398236.1 Rcs stress response system protein RcsF [Pantoea sp. ACRSC]POW61044.1 Rcs stress response system protein RcsF [Pantoea alvi]UBN53758.1 Rcs stress response system protein RcsF [Pantoea agglomerans]